MKVGTNWGPSGKLEEVGGTLGKSGELQEKKTFLFFNSLLE